MWLFNSASRPSSTYDVPCAVVPAVPVVPTVEPAVDVDGLAIVAFARTKPDFGAVPAGAEDASSRQPVTVTVLSSVWLLAVPLGVCAAAPIAVAHAKAVAIHIARFIDNLLGARGLQSRYLLTRAMARETRRISPENCAYANAHREAHR